MGLLLVLVGLLLSPETPATLFRQGNEAYWRGEFEHAASAYEAIARAGIHSPDVYYNWGNAEAEQGHLGPAIWAYEQALALRPNDEDPTHNLEQIRALALEQGLAQGSDQRTILPGDDVGTGLLTAIDPLSLAVAFLAFWIALFALLAWVRRVEPGGSRTAVIFAAVLVGLGSIGTAGFIGGRIYIVNESSYGVVLERASVLSGPGAQYRTVAQVLPGVKVRLRGTDGPWHNVTLPDGSGGWLLGASLRLVRLVRL